MVNVDCVPSGMTPIALAFIVVLNNLSSPGNVGMV
jgi:hypothetical protein